MRAVTLTLLLSLAMTLTAAEVRVGDTLDQVCASLGAPKGQLRVGDRHLLYYDRGEVDLRADLVTRVSLRSVEAQVALEASRAAEATRTREEQGLRRIREMAEGEDLKARKMADRFFQATPPAYQVSFWTNFARRYPDVPVSDQLMMARARLAEQQAQWRTQTEEAERLAELEARIQDAEARAAAAESALPRATYFSSYAYGRRDGRHPYAIGPTQYPASVTWPSAAVPWAVRYVRSIDRPARDCVIPSLSTDFNRRDSHSHDRCFESGTRVFGPRNRL